MKHLKTPLVIGTKSKFATHNINIVNDADGEPLLQAYGIAINETLESMLAFEKCGYSNCRDSYERLQEIVRACNSHDALVEALENELLSIESERNNAASMNWNTVSSPYDGIISCYDKRIQMIRAALALAKEGKP